MVNKLDDGQKFKLTSDQQMLVKRLCRYYMLYRQNFSDLTIDSPKLTSVRNKIKELEDMLGINHQVLRAVGLDEVAE